MLEKYKEEGSHWYDKDGNPCHTVEMKTKKGEFRNTTLSDAKKLNLFPSVTNVMGIVDKPALNNWIRNEYVKATAKLHSRITDSMLEDIQAEYAKRNYKILSPVEFRQAVLEDYKEDATFIGKEIAEEANSFRDATALRGTEIHNIIENFIERKAVDSWSEDGTKTVESFIETVAGAGIIVNGLLSEVSLVSTLGFGGKVDLFSPVQGVIIDIKTKDFDMSNLKGDKGAYSFNSKKQFIYDDVVVQLGAYARMLNESKYAHGNTATFNRGFNLYISRQDPSLMVLHEWDKDFRRTDRTPLNELERGYNKFMLMLELWRYEKGIDKLIAKGEYRV